MTLFDDSSFIPAIGNCFKINRDNTVRAHHKTRVGKFFRCIGNIVDTIDQTEAHFKFEGTDATSNAFLLVSWIYDLGLNARMDY